MSTVHKHATNVSSRNRLFTPTPVNIKVNNMAEPSTSWKERIEPDEAERFSREADVIGAIQQKYSRLYQCPGKAFHRKQLLAAEAVFEVLDGLPPYARFGVFAQPRQYDGLVRLSNGNWGIENDEKPDIRGFAIKILGIEGPDARSGSPTNEHNILMVHMDPLGTDSSGFVSLVQKAAAGELHGDSALAPTFSGFAVESFHTQTPFCVGPYAARGRLIPPRDQRVDTNGVHGWGADVVARLPLTWEYQLQFYVNDDDTPIDDASRVWNESASPYVTVARLTIPAQDITGRWSDEINDRTFLLWDALEEHRPLGEVNRARRVVMDRSVRNRTGPNKLGK
ncbi:Catalase-like domain, heme-dependent [Purpureocillium lavendulum]|uniref:Catalase-like domain, heme-dependent n=1 Tax=Purpureocillium lavendulum TaxID=1247861 RepID=A0AB34FUE8_9HYPO|nr:Catalase-like domain, heme-dependent [Purpureocillium lavendulum]